MSSSVYEMNYAGNLLRYSFLFPQTRSLLRPLPRLAAGEEYDLRVPPENIELGRTILPPDSTDAFVEYRCLIPLTARALLRFDCSIFHAVSFVWRDRAWLLAAPSGTGKTTQFLNWTRLFPGELVIISGDMPMLEAREDGSVWVHSSSWNGKESFGSSLSAKLGGLVLLQQGSENRIEPLSARDAILPLLEQFPFVPDTEEEILRLCHLMERLLLAAPAWRFVNRGDDASTMLLRQTLLDT